MPLSGPWQKGRRGAMCFAPSLLARSLVGLEQVQRLPRSAPDRRSPNVMTSVKSVSNFCAVVSNSGAEEICQVGAKAICDASSLMGLCSTLCKEDGCQFTPMRISTMSQCCFDSDCLQGEKCETGWCQCGFSSTGCVVGQYCSSIGICTWGHVDP
jgi:hypothetical protein